jgi:hypothetical protein
VRTRRCMGLGWGDHGESADEEARCAVPSARTQPFGGVTHVHRASGLRCFCGHRRRCAWALARRRLGRLLGLAADVCGASWCCGAGGVRAVGDRRESCVAARVGVGGCVVGGEAAETKSPASPRRSAPPSATTGKRAGSSRRSPSATNRPAEPFEHLTRTAHGGAVRALGSGDSRATAPQPRMRLTRRRRCRAVVGSPLRCSASVLYRRWRGSDPFYGVRSDRRFSSDGGPRREWQLEPWPVLGGAAGC